MYDSQIKCNKWDNKPSVLWLKQSCISRSVLDLCLFYFYLKIIKSLPCILKRHGEKTDNPSIGIYVNNAEIESCLE